MQRSAANCPPLSWTGSVISLFWQQKTDNLSAYVVILDLECIHMWQAVNHSLCKANICLWSTLSNSLSVMSFLSIMYVHNMYMYICICLLSFCLLCMCITCTCIFCICLLSIVGTGALTRSIIVLHLLYWIKIKNKQTKTKNWEKYATIPSLNKVPLLRSVSAESQNYTQLKQTNKTSDVWPEYGTLGINGLMISNLASWAGLA